MSCCIPDPEWGKSLVVALGYSPMDVCSGGVTVIGNRVVVTIPDRDDKGRVRVDIGRSQILRREVWHDLPTWWLESQGSSIETSTVAVVEGESPIQNMTVGTEEGERS